MVENVSFATAIRWKIMTQKKATDRANVSGLMAESYTDDVKADHHALPVNSNAVNI